MLKKDYSKAEWSTREDYYISNVIGIVIPQMTTTKELQCIAAQIDEVLTNAYFDKATIYKKLESAKSLLSRTESQAWVTIDTLKLEKEKGKKLLKEEKEGLVSAFLDRQKYEGTSLTLQEYYDEMKARASFIDSVIYALKGKSGVVLNHITLLKIEKDLA